MRGLRRHAERVAGLQTPSANHKATERRDVGLYDTGKGEVWAQSSHVEARLTSEERRKFTRSPRKWVECKTTGIMIQVPTVKSGKARARVRRKGERKSLKVGYFIRNADEGALHSENRRELHVPRKVHKQGKRAVREFIGDHCGIERNRNLYIELDA